MVCISSGVTRKHANRASSIGALQLPAVGMPAAARVHDAESLAQAIFCPANRKPEAKLGPVNNPAASNAMTIVLRAINPRPGTGWASTATRASDVTSAMLM
jgi:hypothetical protein